MSFEERHVWIGTGIGLSAITVYLIIIITRAQSVPIDQVEWAMPMLATVLIAGGLYGANYVTAKVRHRGTATADARDVEIDRHGELAGKGLLSLSVTAAIVMIALDVNGFWVAHTLFGGAYLSSLIGSLAKAAAYREGLPS